MFLGHFCNFNSVVDMYHSPIPRKKIVSTPLDSNDNNAFILNPGRKKNYPFCTQQWHVSAYEYDTALRFTFQEIIGKL